MRHACTQALMHSVQETTYPCVDSLRVQGDVNMDHPNANAAADQYHCNPLVQMRCTVNACNTRRCRCTRERTYILTPLRLLLLLALPGTALYRHGG